MVLLKKQRKLKRMTLIIFQRQILGLDSIRNGRQKFRSHERIMITYQSILSF